VRTVLLFRQARKAYSRDSHHASGYRIPRTEFRRSRLSRHLVAHWAQTRVRVRRGPQAMPLLLSHVSMLKENGSASLTTITRERGVFQRPD
jgi:hypothetical protein